jgi:sialate O-acetylesterase
MQCPPALASLALLALTLTPFAHGAVRLPHVLSDHAVLQRDRPIHIWGWATPGVRLAAHFHAQTVPAIADSLGKWSLWLAPEPAGGPYTLSITGDGAEKRLTDLLVGDVWFASGQSNMEISLSGFGASAPIKDGPKEIAAANNPRIRLLVTEKKTSDIPLDENPGVWTTCTPQTAAYFSAVAYFFGREIASRENVPIGLIDSTWGGTPADSWVSMDTLGTDPRLLPVFADRALFAKPLADTDAILAAEKREDDAAQAAGKPAPAHHWHPFEGSWGPAKLFNGMIAPYTPLSIRGFLWYQGESNAAHERAQYYKTLFPALIADWRMQFQQGELPFLFVQISSFNSPGDDWGTVRDAQRQTLSVANTAMAVTLDVGLRDNVHPPDKQTVAFRLSLAARAMVYGERIPYSSPLFRQATHELTASGANAMRVWFDHAEGLNSNGHPVEGFELAGEDGHFLPAEAQLEGTTAVVSSPSVPNPMYVRYAWTGFFPNNLYNAAGLPASTFTSLDNPLH